MAEHSPLPLAFDPESDGDILIASDGRIVADCQTFDFDNPSRSTHEENKANAAFFLRACNAYPELVKALEECVAVLTDPVVGTYDADDPRWYKLLDEAVANALAALAKAKACG